MIDPRRLRELKRLADSLGILNLTTVKIDWHLLDCALVHPTFSQTYNNDRLEFLGDSVLRLATTLFLGQEFNDRSLGEMAALRSNLVSDHTLAAIAETYELDLYLVASDGVKLEPKARQTRLADALEAVMGALYLSTKDLSLVCPWLYPHLQRIALSLLEKPALGNFKEALQELTQAHWKKLPEYRNREIDSILHIFQAEVWLNDRCWGEGEGKSIKAAQQNAAAIALESLKASFSNS
jgi:ribonuclease III